MSDAERLLTCRLEDLARALGRSGAPRESVFRLLELASVATVHAVALEMLSTERVDRSWKRAAAPAAAGAPVRRAA